MIRNQLFFNQSATFEYEGNAGFIDRTGCKSISTMRELVKRS